MTLPLVEQVTVRRDVVHTRLPGHRPLSLDLYLPEGGARALCVYVHGGGWRVGSRREGPGPLSADSGERLVRLAQSGLAVASVDYRLSGEAVHPAQVQDLRSACRWLLEDEPDVDGLPLVLFGVSAGGQVAGVCALDGSLPVQALALWYPVTDLLGLPGDLEAVGAAPDLGPGSREALLLGAVPGDVPDRAREASPLHHVRVGAPPSLLVHGNADVLVPPVQSERLHEALVRSGCRSSLELLDGHQHLLTGMPEAEVRALVDRTAGFLLDR